MSADDLEPIAPSDAVDLYLADIQESKSQWTQYTHKSRLSHFLDWCSESGVKNINELTGRDLHKYKIWRGEDVSTVTLKSDMNTLRVFIRFCESIEAIREGTAEKILAPSLSKNDDNRDEVLDAEAAQSILDYLDTYEYASRDHVTLVLIWHCLFRRGGVRALDLSGYNSDEESIEVTHRPEYDTPLKNKAEGERFLAVKPWVTTVIDDYIDTHRLDNLGKYGRDPLLTTNDEDDGRPHFTTIQTSAYAWTRPCKTNGGNCPHGREPSDCDAAQTRGDASKCPSSVGPHAIRRGAITEWLKNVPKPIVADRADNTPEVLDKHYDQRTEEEKMEQRRKYLDDI